MASADWYTPSGVPGTGAQGSSLDIRNEFGRLETALDKLPTLSGGAGKVIVVNGSASGLEAVTTIAGLTLTTTTLTAPVINGVVTTTGLTLPAFTLGGTVTSNGQTFSGTIADLGIVTTVDINGGTIDGTVVGGSSEAAGSFTTLSASTSITGTLATAAQGNITSLGTLTTLTVDNITLNGNAITSDAAAALTITATAGQVVQVESVTFDAGVVAGATSITSTAFAGDLTGDVTGNTSGTAATVTGATQAAITTTANLTTVGALNAGSITSGFGAIDIGASAFTTTGTAATGALTVTGTLGVSGTITLDSGTALSQKNSEGVAYPLIQHFSNDVYIDSYGNSTTGGNIRLRPRSSNGVVTEAVLIDPTRNVTISTGNLIIGTSGKGIDFDAAAGGTSQLLDWYEEGTFTPIITFGGAHVGAVYNLQTGFYTRVGDLVTAMIEVGTSTKSSSTGTAEISGLPFAATGVSVGALYPSSVTFADILINQVQTSTVRTLPVEITNGGSATVLTDANFATASSLRSTVNYKA